MYLLPLHMLMIPLLSILNRPDCGLISRSFLKVLWFFIQFPIVFRGVALLIILNISEEILEIGGIVRQGAEILLNPILNNLMLVSLLILRIKIGKKSNYIKNLIDKLYFLELAHF